MAVKKNNAKSDEIQLKWQEFCEKAINSTFVVPLSLKAGEKISFTSFEIRQTKAGKDLLLLNSDDGKQVPLFMLPELGAMIKNGEMSEFKPFGITITEVIKNQRGYTTYLCSLS